MAPLVLASASPRRQQLLALLGVPFEVCPSQAEENAEGPGPSQVQTIALAKGREVCLRMPGRFVLSADTLVCVDGHILGKPRDKAHAAAMLRMLSGRHHQVHTGVCLFSPDGSVDSRVETTHVEFLPLSEELICRYIATGEPMDKAGAYAIQGHSGMFISRIEGSPSNVVGLPLSLAGDMLAAANFSLLQNEAR